MAIKNISESANTIKQMWELMPSDNWSYDRAVIFCNYDNKCITQDELILDKYYSYLSQFLIEIDLDEKYFYNPQLFANDYYGDPGFDYIVLYFSGCKSLFEFKKSKINVFDYSHLKELNQLFTHYKTRVEESKKNPVFIDSSKVTEKESSAKFIKSRN